MVGCLAVFHHLKSNKRDCKTLRTIYGENTQLALTNLGEGVEKTTSLKEQFFTTTNALEKRLQQAHADQFPGDSDWRVCVMSEEEKKIMESCHRGAPGGL